MAKRKTIPKSIRFEVLKRDSFKCQYCGASAPDVLLHIDHINPVSKGGDNNIFNLVTSCESCNLGKKNKLLTDKSSISKQKKQLEEMQLKYEQLEMLLEWRENLMDFESKKLKKLIDYVNNFLENDNKILSETGEKILERLLKKYNFESILDAVDDCYYSKYNIVTDLERFLKHRSIKNSKQINYILKVIKNALYLRYSDPTTIKLLNRIFQNIDGEVLEKTFQILLLDIKDIIKDSPDKVDALIDINQFLTEYEVYNG
jgi:hypothetical protein